MKLKLLFVIEKLDGPFKCHALLLLNKYEVKNNKTVGCHTLEDILYVLSSLVLWLGHGVSRFLNVSAKRRGGGKAISVSYS